MLNEFKDDLARLKKTLSQIQIIKWKRICEYCEDRCNPIYQLYLIICRRLQITYGIKSSVMTKGGKGFMIEYPYEIIDIYNAVMGELI